VASLEDWNSTIELHPQTGRHFNLPELLVNSPVFGPGEGGEIVVQAPGMISMPLISGL
jgi:hypothetical protein